MTAKWTSGQRGGDATATFRGEFDPAKTDYVLGGLVVTGMLGGYVLDGDTLTLSWPVGATPPSNPYKGWHSKLAERISFDSHDPTKTASQTAATFVDLVLYDVCRCKVPLPAQKQA